MSVSILWDWVNEEQCGVVG